MGERNFELARHEGDGQVVFPGVTRVLVTDSSHVVVFKRYGLFEGGVEVHLQDDGKTLKIFPLRSEGY